ncbi:hypothetical protein BT96DRAFT_1007418 [Gymnopus androsaceus JB14]|uniref:Uncharacterized protein n=1 Tax=Gymnopus androsaceus JB14 TaxID=1447944 RepID=A0A6A4GI91_9AGAR|nr:hypothetical protein BT96DRAFT_1007418 [Gymnopus androsaceus JB14]
MVGTRNTNKQITEQEKNDIEKRLMQQKLLAEGEDYFKAFPIQLIKIAEQQLKIAVANAPEKKQAWENVMMMAKLMKGRGKQPDDGHLTNEMVDDIVGRVAEKNAEALQRAVDATENFKQATDKLETLAEKLTDFEQKMNPFTLPPNSQTPFSTLLNNEEGEIPSRPTYAQITCTGAGDIAQQLQRPKHNAAIQAGHMNDRRFII